jgi:hypothetical protein
MEVQSPLLEENGVLYTGGNEIHNGPNGVYILIQPDRRALEVGLWDNGTFKIYKTGGASILKPESVKIDIKNSEEFYHLS